MYRLSPLVLLLTFLLSGGISGKLIAQTKGPSLDNPKVDLNNVKIDSYQIQMRNTSAPVKIDGILDDEVWSYADSVTNFYQNYPYDTGYAYSNTVAKVAYDKNFVYIAAICYDNIPGRYVAPNLNRDWSVRDTDGFQWNIDTYNDKTNGFGFAVSAYNVQREGLIANGGDGGFMTAWDNKWYSEVKHYGDRWVMEAAIPFKTLRFTPGSKEWRINFARIDYKRNEMSVWVPLYRNYSISNLAFTGKMVWDKPLTKQGPNISLIPYLSGQSNLDVSRTGNPTQSSMAVGLDAKVGLTPALNLDLTVNPDFSQVEVDRQVTNLSRFELFFPEQRNFFLENADLFSSYGGGSINPFFSRRIGIAFDRNSGLYVNDPILFGARVSGKLDDDWRIGALAMQTPNNQNLNRAGQQYSMFSLQRKMFARSFVSGFLVNRQSSGTIESFSVGPNGDDFNRVAGLEYNIHSADNRWTGKVFHHQSFSSGEAGSPMASYGRIGYNDRKLSGSTTIEHVGQNFRADVGFIPRNAFNMISQRAGYTFLPKNSFITGHGPSASYSIYTGLDNSLQDRDFNLGYSWGFNNTSYLSASANHSFVRLFAPFNPTNMASDTARYATGTEFNMGSASLSYQSDVRRKLYGSASLFAGQYFGGDRYSASGSIVYRYMPYASFGLQSTYNRLELPSQWGDRDLFLIGPSVNLTFTNSLFFKVFYQYNNQIDNMNLNARFQWRFAPVSDLFIVYTDNYSLDYRVKNRALVLKLTYWLNV